MVKDYSYTGPELKTQRFSGNADMMNVFTPLEYSAIRFKRMIVTLRKEKKLKCLFDI